MFTLISWRRPAVLAACGVLCFFLYFFGLTRTGMLSTDEPRYAAVGKAMADSGDWITPRLWGEPWFEKPPLLYWMTAAALKAGLGPDLAPRLPVAALSVAFLIFFFLALRREFGERVALFASAMLATSAGWLAYSHVAVTDLPLSATFAAAMLLVMPREKSSESNSRAALWAGFLLGLAILAKGLTPLALFVPALWFLRRRLGDLMVLAGGAAAVAGPWYVMVAQRNGWPFFQEFIWKHHVLRFFTGELQHVQPFWYYVPVLAAGLFPWTPLAALLLSRRLYSGARTRFLLAWFAWGFVLFSLSRNKLPGYLLPLLPAIAALAAIALDEARERSGKVATVVAATAVLLGFLPAVPALLPQALTSGITRSHLEFPFAWILPTILAAMLVMRWEFREQRLAAVGFLAMLASAGVVWLVLVTYPVLDQTVSARSFWLSNKESITCVGESNRSWRYGLQYYAGRTLPDCQ